MAWRRRGVTVPASELARDQHVGSARTSCSSSTLTLQPASENAASAERRVARPSVPASRAADRLASSSPRKKTWVTISSRPTRRNSRRRASAAGTFARPRCETSVASEPSSNGNVRASRRRNRRAGCRGAHGHARARSPRRRSRQPAGRWLPGGVLEASRGRWQRPRQGRHHVPRARRRESASRRALRARRGCRDARRRARTPRPPGVPVPLLEHRGAQEQVGAVQFFE